MRKTKKKATKKKTSKKKPGRPKRKFSIKVVKRIEELAFKGCQTRTIAAIMGIPEQTLRDNFRGVLEKKRAERKEWLRDVQNTRAKNDNSAAIAIFLGKNELDQVDRKEISGPGGEPIPLTIVHFGDK